jgi:hypothetical protein
LDMPVVAVVVAETVEELLLKAVVLVLQMRQPQQIPTPVVVEAADGCILVVPVVLVVQV